MVSVPFPNNGQNKNFKKDFNGENHGLVPPQNIQAEEAVLGGILLDPDAIGRIACLLYTTPSPRDRTRSRMPSSA